MAKHEIAKAYNHHEVEDKWYEYWMKNGYFYAKVNPEKKPYTIVIRSRNPACFISLHPFPADVDILYCVI